MTPYYADDAVTLYHGDCREILPSIAPKSVDLLLTDPPYGIRYRGRGEHGPMVGDDGTLDVPAVLGVALQRLRINRHFYVFGPWDVAALTVAATTELIWNKGKCPAGGNLSIPWGGSHERIGFGVWNPFPSQRGVGTHTVRLRRGSVLSVATVSTGRGAQTHPTEKPVMLLRELIEASSLMGETVLDPFAGAGSTLTAAKLEGRRAIGIEIEERYCEVIAKRLSQEALDFGESA